MKKTLLTVLITLVAVAGVILLTHAFWGEGECIFGRDDDKTECTKEEMKLCCDKEVRKDCCDKKHYDDAHAGMMEELVTLRAEFDAQLSEEEKTVIAGIREKFGEMDHSKLCPEGRGKFMDENKADFEALNAIADNHKEYFDGMMAMMHEDGMCKAHKDIKNDPAEEAEVEVEVEVEVEGDGETARAAASKCPEVANCKEATEKCKGEMTKEAGKISEAEAEEKCREAEKKCEDEMKAKCQQECMSTFRIHFLLLSFA